MQTAHRGAGLVVLGLLLAGAFAGSAQAVPAADAKMRICHATASKTNPYVSIEVSISALGGKGNGDHYDHSGDIIPPVNGHSGLNWDASGTAIYAAGCRPVALADADSDGTIDLLDLDDDNDGLPDATDVDDDGDGISDDTDPTHELTTDTDGDQVPDGLDPDDDGDGLDDAHDPDSSACRPRSTTPGSGGANAPQDADSDGLADAVDLDDDGDGIPDFMDPDDNDNAVPDGAEPEARALPLAPSRCLQGTRLPIVDDAVDLDGDKTPNGDDQDDDGDGIRDTRDRDQDGDGVPSTRDGDDDGDGIDDLADKDRAVKDDPRATDTDRDGIPDLRDGDVDGDGIANSRDADGDGDGILETRKAELAPGTALVTELRDLEVNRLFTGTPQTSDGRPLHIKARCFAMTPRTLDLGGSPDVDLTKRSCKVQQRGSKVSLEVDASGRPLRVVVTVTAPPTGDARAYRDEVVYEVQPSTR